MPTGSSTCTSGTENHFIGACVTHQYLVEVHAKLVTQDTTRAMRLPIVTGLKDVCVMEENCTLEFH